MKSAIMLAAGESSRMGTLKALLPWAGSTLIEAQIEQVAGSQIDELIVILGYQKDLLEPTLLDLKARYKSCLNMRIVINEHYQSGKTSSIRAGMEDVLPDRCRGVIIIGVDQPVRAETVNHLFNELGEGKIAIPVYQGRKGHPPIFSSNFYPQLNNVTEEGEGLRDVMNNQKLHIQFIEVGDPRVLLNLNTELDYIDALNKGLDDYK